MHSYTGLLGWPFMKRCGALCTICPVGSIADSHHSVFVSPQVQLRRNQVKTLKEQLNMVREVSNRAEVVAQAKAGEKKTVRRRTSKSA